MISATVDMASTSLSEVLGAAAVVSLIVALVLRELASAHAEETWDLRSDSLSRTLLIPILPLLVVFACIVVGKVLGAIG